MGSQLASERTGTGHVKEVLDASMPIFINFTTNVCGKISGPIQNEGKLLELLSDLPKTTLSISGQVRAQGHVPATGLAPAEFPS